MDKPKDERQREHLQPQHSSPSNLESRLQEYGHKDEDTASKGSGIEEI